jgi:hypothetical protein
MADEWLAFDSSQVAAVQRRPGVFELVDSEKTTVYIGSSDNVRITLEQHCGNPRSCVRQYGKYFRVEYSNDYRRVEAVLRKLFRDVFGKEPICNEVEAARSDERRSTGRMASFKLRVRKSLTMRS